MTYSHHNDSNEIQVRLTYSNIALLQHMEIYVLDYEPLLVIDRGEPAPQHVTDPKRTNPYGMFLIGDDGGLLMPYETLINPTAVQSNPLHFPWAQVKAELDKLEALGSDYIGRHVHDVQHGHRPHQRHHAELLRDRDDPPAEDHRPSASSCVGRDQLLLLREWLQHGGE
ncbi:MAG: Gentisate 1,2-dioxygenase (EC [uncultured Caballeronia sp.]|nr:MAG: Gentisate 1,2-dioxygenase (EC [uncultured Caballeronia sp.]